MADQRVQRRLAAILAADVVGYSRLMREDEAGTLAQLKTLRKELLDPKVAEFGGRVVKATGDGVLIEFPSAVDAVQHALDVQGAMRRRMADVPKGRRIQLRMGINVGDVIVDGEDLYGDGVNIASRLEGLAEPGCTCISSSVYEQVRHKIDLAYDDLGEQSVKNIAEPVHVYRLAPSGPAGPGASGLSSEALFRRPAVAVLPFENLSGDPEQEFFADGLTEDIITALSLWRSFPVIARNSTFAYKATSPDVRQVGEVLGARYVIEGSVRKAGNRIRVTAQLINAETGHHVWADRYEGSLDEIFELQDELTRRLAATIAPELERAEQTRVQSRRPTSLDAWEHVQRGVAWLSERTLEGNTRARKAFKRAIDLDPGYSRAFTGLSWSHHRDLAIAAQGFRDEALSQAISTARRAIALDPRDSLAHDMLGIALIQAGDYDGSIAEFEHAIALNPSDFNAYVSMGLTLTLAGRPNEGVAALEKGFDLNPNEPRNHLFFAFMARAHLTARRYDEAIEWTRKSIRWRPDTVEPHLILASALGHLDQLQGASAALSDCERIDRGYMASPDAWYRYKNDADAEHFLDGLRKAGWKG